jgi:putative FmdB family regulatory protein
LPLYPYRCTQCGHRFEKIQHFRAEPEKVCPKCGGVLERLLTAPGLKFKGSGGYVNDYAAKSGSSAESSPKDAAPAAGSGEKKPAAGSKTKSSAGATGGAASSATSRPAVKPSTTKD